MVVKIVKNLSSGDERPGSGSTWEVKPSTNDSGRKYGTFRDGEHESNNPSAKSAEVHVKIVEAKEKAKRYSA